MAVDWAIEAPARNRAAPAERSPKGDSVSDKISSGGGNAADWAIMLQACL